MLSLTWFGNATVKVTANDSRLVFDPFITLNPALYQLKTGDIQDVSAILLTHGHFDHAADIPFFSKRINAKILLPAEVAKNLEKFSQIRRENFYVPGFLDPVPVGSVKATMYPSRHIRFDVPLVFTTLLRALMSPKRLFTILRLNQPMGRCVGWLIEVNGLRMFHLGSLGLEDEGNYPTGIDIFSLPLQGHSRIYDKALEMIDRLKPKGVFIHHFDDGFPPISQQIPTAPFVALLAETHPELRVIVPEYGKTYKWRENEGTAV